MKIRGPRFVMGSASDCSLCCRCKTVSAHHCELRIEQQGVVLRALSREKGTFVNDVLVEHEQVLQAGDHLRIGRLEFEVLIEESAPVPGGERLSQDESQGDWVADAISESLVEADEQERARRLGHPESRQLDLESSAGEAAKAQPLAAQAPPSGDAGKKPTKVKTEPGKLPPHTTNEIVGKDSKDAAQQALRKMFSR